MDTNSLIREIFSGRETSLTEDGCFIDLYHPKRPAIPIRNMTLNYLINNCILGHDSGNFDTGEEHYVYNRENKFNSDLPKNIHDELLSILRDMRLQTLT